MLEDILGDHDQGPRVFHPDAKKELYEKDPTCTICKQKIQSLDDAHVDHKIAYAKGGRTNADNAGLAHRFCNVSKGAGD